LQNVSGDFSRIDVFNKSRFFSRQADSQA